MHALIIPPFSVKSKPFFPKKSFFSLEELRAVSDLAHARGMRVFLDGARLGSALAALGLSLGEFIGKAGVDVFTVGGTKAGACSSMAVVFTDKALLRQGEYMVKQSLQHFDKSKSSARRWRACLRGTDG